MKNRRLVFSLLLVAFLSVASTARADLIGPALGPLPYPTDTAVNNVLVIYTAFPMTAAGWLDYFQSYVMAGSNDPAYGAGAFTAMLLRPQATPNSYTVLASQAFTAPVVTTGGLHTYNLTTPWLVQAGDFYAHFGNGVPLAIGGVTNEVQLLYPTTTMPAEGDTFTAGAPGYPVFGTVRSYSLAANVEPIPEPASMLLLGSGLAGLAAAVRKRKK